MAELSNLVHAFFKVQWTLLKRDYTLDLSQKAEKR